MRGGERRGGGGGEFSFLAWLMFDFVGHPGQAGKEAQNRETPLAGVLQVA
jgi:hypothetical protein